MRIVFAWLTGIFFLVTIAAFSQNQNIRFRIDVITHLNTASEFFFEENTIYAATSGGLLIYNQDSDQLESMTSVDGIYDHYLTALANSGHDQLIMGSLSGNLSFLNLNNNNITNDQNLTGTEIVDILAVEDTLWVLSKDFISVYLYNTELQRYQFRESYQEFNANIGDFYTIQYARNRIWLANEIGLISAPANFLKYNLYAAANWNLKTQANGLPGNEIRDIHFDEDSDLLYLATNGGLTQYNFSSFTRLTTNFVRYLHQHNGQLYAADTRRVFQLQSGQLQPLFSISYTLITDLAVDQNGQVWVSTEKTGIRNLTTSERVLADGPLNNYVGEIYVDDEGYMWCSSGILGDTKQLGIYIRTPDGWNNFFFSGGTSNRFRGLNSSNPVFEDAAGNVWMGSWGGGIVIFDHNLNYQTINTIPDPGKVWISSINRDDTLSVSTPPELRDKIFPIASSDGLSSVVTDFMINPVRQSIFILDYFTESNKPLVEYTATAFGDEAYLESSWKYFEGPFNRNEVHKITQDPFNDMWVSTSEGVVQVRLEGDSLSSRSFREGDNLKTNATTTVAADDDGYVWVGTRSGLNAILSGTVFDFRETYQPIGLKINDIFIDSRNNKWFATDKGLSILKASGSPFDPASWVDLVPRNSSIIPEQLALRANLFREDLPSENIHSVFLDENTGDVYLGTDAGIAIIRNNPFASTFTNFEQLKVGPNPFVIGDDQNNMLNFYNLVAGSEVKILTVNGQLIRILNPQNFDEVKGGLAQWNGRSEDGKFVSTGVYLYLITTEEGQDKAGKVLVIRQ